MCPRKKLFEGTGSGFIFWAQWFLAQLALTFVLFCFVWVDSGGFPVQYRGLLLFVCMASIPVTMVVSPYLRSRSSLYGCIRIFFSWICTLSILLCAIDFTGTGNLFNSSLLAYWAIASFFIQIICYIPLHHLARYYRQRLMNESGVLVYGSGELVESVTSRLLKLEGIKFLGVVSSDSSTDSLGDGFHYPILGSAGDLHQVIEQFGVGRLYLALSLANVQEIENLYIDLLDSGVDVIWVPDIDSMVLLNHSVSDLDGLPAISLNQSPLTRYPLASIVKSLLDRLGALAGILLLSPILFIVAMCVKTTSKGPVIFKQKRHGWNGQVIEVWKFRSMKLHNDSLVSQATKSDPRITSVGRFIRRTSIDELPQLFNVLQGDMSLVGPRPHAVAHNDYYSGKIHAYMARHRIKPGITGLAQVSGYRGETETIDKMERRVEYDLDYINNWSIWLDIKILFKTPFSLIKDSAY